MLIRFLVNNNTPYPLFFVSVASKGLNVYISPVFATLTRWSISVADKRLSEDPTSEAPSPHVFIKD